MSINRWMNIPSSQQKWERIKNNKNFWHNLPWMPEIEHCGLYISKFNPQILSAYVEETYDPNCIFRQDSMVKKKY